MPQSKHEMGDGSCSLPRSFLDLHTSFPVSITQRVILVFKDMHLSCNMVPQIKPATSSGTLTQRKAICSKAEGKPAGLDLLRDGALVSVLRDL